MDVFGSALKDHFLNQAEKLLLFNNYDDPEDMPIDVFFRTEEEMSPMELHALSLCEGSILDVGAGVGSHSILLQHRGKHVDALEISSIACSIMKQRGVNQIINDNFFNYKERKYQTILMLMNGIGLSGSLKKLPDFLQHCKALLSPGGQILFDSSDISYLYEDLPRPENRYFGEISYQYEYRGIKSKWFDWLYIDQITLKSLAANQGLHLDVLIEDDHDQYLGRLTRAK